MIKMGLVKVKCKCGEIIDEEDIATTSINSSFNTITILIECYNCGRNKEIEVELPKFLKIVNKICSICGL